MGNPVRSRESGVQSVDRAITVLELIAGLGEAGVSELAAALEVHKSTAFRLLGALEEHGLVEQIGDRGKYRLGFGLIPLAGRVAERLEVTTQGRPVCDELAARLGETVNIAIPDRGFAVNVDQARGPSMVTTYNWLGRITPMHNTSSGKVLLAAAVIDDPTALPDEVRPADRAALSEELAEVAAAGYAWSMEELETGLNAVAAPVRDHSGSVVAALSVSGPSYRLSVERIELITPDVVAAGREISRRMGFWEPPA
ncbi:MULTISPECIES: IclR family transcriptional regulator [Pseudonocardia]|uniref:Glycerol operon regulatory protein n=2 Tax=Pseudonocardia TaxID=1847 RepID=A0A1Y2MM64_PSEAH|nr:MULTISPECIES: IclR family transcriptional regulator [Pseudonocardia]OSY36355.1 Transcriptional regulator KdgR [Pseudonocardia autotrophica]TDN72689.1 IclR family transcriptional regulator [Pseudonocardia autotrophica]BBG03400.1 IclR family transcriptional regulator [Pseudonocardia autotrophica]GEC27245.1 IclR family transcriptional regulator [Pseudonocardia saturnea]